MATCETEQWTEEQCVELIRAFRARPVLWDPKNPFYFKKKRKVSAWAEIGNAINRLPFKCKHKMGVLMSSFRREKARIMHSIQGGDPTKFYTSNWFGFKEMTFLIDKETERQRRIAEARGTGTKSTNENKRDPIALSNQLVKLCSVEAPPENVTPSPPVSTNPRTIESDEEIKAFTNFIASKMKKYSETTKNRVQHVICEIIFKADLGYFDKANCDSPSTSQSPHPSGSKLVTFTNDDIIETSVIKEENDYLSGEEVEMV